MQTLNPFVTNKPRFLHVFSTSLENTVKKEEIARDKQFLPLPQCFLTIWNFLPFSRAVFYSYWGLSAVFITFESVVCKLLQFESLKYFVWERIKTLTRVFKNLRTTVET